MKTYIGIIILLCICILGMIIKYNLRKPEIIYNNKLQDSLLLVIHNQDSIINKYKNDSIIYSNKKEKIIIKYEKIYADYSNPIIISDDSITSYISKKLHNK